MELYPARRVPAAIATLVVALLSSVSICYGVVQTETYKKGKEAFVQGDYNRSMALFAPAAEEGDPWAQFALGVLYLKGKGVEPDPVLSTQWFRKAAKQSLPDAQFNLGNAYMYGRGVRADIGKAAAWWQLAAEQGHAKAQFNLGTQLYFERDSDANKRLGIAWLGAAAAQGDEVALRQLKKLDDATKKIRLKPGPEADEIAILLQRPDNYCIQLFAARRESSVERFLEMENLAKRARVFRIPRDGAPWYGILFGSYREAAEVKKTLVQLRPTLKQYGPWVRRFSDIQKEIRKVHEGITGVACCPPNKADPP